MFAQACTCSPTRGGGSSRCPRRAAPAGSRLPRAVVTGSPVDLGVHDCGRDVVGRLCTPRFDVADEELEQRHEVVEALAGSVRRVDRRIGPAPELVAVGRVDAEQLGDDQHRKRCRDRFDEVDLGAGRHLVEHGARHGTDAIFERPDRTGREPARHQTAPGCVLGRVHVQDRAFDHAAVAQRIVQQNAAARTEALGVAAHGAHVGVTRDRPRVRRVLAHGRVARATGRARRSSPGR